MGGQTLEFSIDLRAFDRLERLQGLRMEDIGRGVSIEAQERFPIDQIAPDQRPFDDLGEQDRRLLGRDEVFPLLVAEQLPGGPAGRRSPDHFTINLLDKRLGGFHVVGAHHPGHRETRLPKAFQLFRLGKVFQVDLGGVEKLDPVTLHFRKRAQKKAGLLLLQKMVYLPDAPIDVA